jgi:hypothetical protein
MSALDILKWIVGVLMLIGWATMYAAGCLPDNWEWLTIAIVSALFGLQPLVSGVKAASKGTTNAIRKMAQPNK